MNIPIPVPAFGESITSATLSAWLIDDQTYVNEGQAIASLETDKVAVDIEAPSSGILSHQVLEGDTVQIGAIIGSIEDHTEINSTETPQDILDESKTLPISSQPETEQKAFFIPETPIRTDSITESNKRFTRTPLSNLRKTIAKRLVEAQHQAAILTTFNECDMTAVQEIRHQFNQKYIDNYGVKLGYMSFFIKSVVKALQEVPALNSKIDGDDLIQNHYYDVSIAIGTDKGLLTPVIRDADTKSLMELERELLELAHKSRTGKINLSELQGGCFTISNGGTYGSLLSTPILNPPQSGILGMHTIQDRPVVRDHQIVIRPMMYLAVSYDHRIVDGQQAVKFLLKIKESIENPIFEL